MSSIFTRMFSRNRSRLVLKGPRNHGGSGRPKPFQVIIGPTVAAPPFGSEWRIPMAENETWLRAICCSAKLLTKRKTASTVEEP
jgi:hypothetical protein